MTDTAGFFCVTDRTVPRETTDALRAACDARGIAYYPLVISELRAEQLAPLPRGAMLYAPATDERAMRAEARLWAPGVASVFAGALGPLAPVVEPTAAFRLAGVPVPDAVPLLGAGREALGRVVEALGGFPVVLRLPGYSGGRGILRAESPAGLFALADHLGARGVVPEVVRFVGGATMWRVVVVDGRAVGATRGVVPEGDFRSVESDEDADYTDTPDADLAAVAVQAAAAVQAHAAGVDVLRTEDGACLVLEANTPFYFGHLQRRGIDVAGALVEALLGQVGAATGGQVAR